MTKAKFGAGTPKPGIGALLLAALPLAPAQAAVAPLAEGPKTCPVASITPVKAMASVSAPRGTADLNSVIATVEAAINCYQSHRGTGADALPPLQAADFDFKTTTGKVGGLSVSFFIFKIGASSEKDTANDLTFSYALPKPPKASAPGATAHRAQPPQLLADAIVADIQSAAAAVKDQAKLGDLTFSKLKISLQFGVTFDGTASVNAPVQLVTLGGNGEYKKNETQSVTLTFASGGT